MKVNIHLQGRYATDSVYAQAKRLHEPQWIEDMVTYKREQWSNVKVDIERLAHAHFAECGIGREADSFELDHDTFNTLNRMGDLHVMVARIDHKMIGYIIHILSPRHIYHKAKTANQVGWYVSPEQRKGLVGLQLLKQSEEDLTKMGVELLMSSHTTSVDASVAFKRLGWNCTEKHYSKWVN